MSNRTCGVITCGGLLLFLGRCALQNLHWFGQAKAIPQHSCPPDCLVGLQSMKIYWFYLLARGIPRTLKFLEPLTLRPSCRRESDGNLWINCIEIRCNKFEKQVGAELCQAQPEAGLTGFPQVSVYLVWAVYLGIRIWVYQSWWWLFKKICLVGL